MTDPAAELGCFIFTAHPEAVWESDLADLAEDFDRLDRLYRRETDRCPAGGVVTPERRAYLAMLRRDRDWAAERLGEAARALEQGEPADGPSSPSSSGPATLAASGAPIPAAGREKADGNRAAPFLCDDVDERGGVE